MGIKDLLPALQQFAVQKSIKEFRGCKIAIDASGWLHKAVYTMVEDLIDSGFYDSQLYVDFILVRVTELRVCGIEPVMVFDGQRNHLKSETNTKREEYRRLNMEQGHRLLDSMRATADHACRAKLRQEAISCFQKGLGVKHDMEKNTIAALQKLQVSVVVAPYEADCELVHLCQIGICQAVMTEDSDVLVYSAISGKPFPILFKFDKSTQMVQCMDIDKILQFNDSALSSQDSVRSNAITSDEIGSKEKTFIKNLRQFIGPRGRRMFVQMCVLAGCDYCDSIHGVGIVTAQQFKNVEDDVRLQRVCRYFKLSCNKQVPDSYIQRVLRAEALFHYQVVYNPKTKGLKYFSDPILQSPVNRAPDTDFWDDSLFISQDSQSTLQEYWKGPLIEKSELQRVGAITLEDFAKENTTNAITIEKLCVGVISMKEYTPIVPRFPWDLPDIHRTSQKYLMRTPTSPTSPVRSFSSYLWSYRRSLMSHFEGLKSHPMLSIPSRPIPLMEPVLSPTYGNAAFRFGESNASKPSEQPAIKSQTAATQTRNEVGFQQFAYNATKAIAIAIRDNQSEKKRGYEMISHDISSQCDDLHANNEIVKRRMISANPYSRQDIAMSMKSPLKPPLRITVHTNRTKEETYSNALRLNREVLDVSSSSISPDQSPRTEDILYSQTISSSASSKASSTQSNASRTSANANESKDLQSNRPNHTINANTIITSKIESIVQKQSYSLVYDTVELSIDTDMISKDKLTEVKTPTGQGFVTLLHDDNRDSNSSVSSDDDQVNEDLSSDTLTYNPLSRPLSKRKYVDVPVLSNGKALTRGSTVKRIKSTGTTMRLPSITSFFTPAK